MQTTLAHEHSDEIPGLDLGPYLRGQAGALESLAGRLREFSERVGFYYIENHGVSQDVIDRAFAAAQRFHALPMARKKEIAINEDNVGYMGLNESMQRHSKVEVATKPNYNESFFCMRDRAP